MLEGQIFIAPRIVPQITAFDAHLSSFFYFPIRVFAIKRRNVVGFACALPYNNIFAAESFTLKFLSVCFPILAISNPVPYFTSLLLYYSDGPYITLLVKSKRWCRSLWVRNWNCGASHHTTSF